MAGAIFAQWTKKIAATKRRSAARVRRPKAIVNHKPAVLIVDDEPLVRMHVEEFLYDAGYEIVSASDADEAIAILEKRDDIQVVITDIQMPGSMDGVRLAHAVRDRWPPVAIIVTSGRAAPLGELPENSRFFPKPVREREVLGALREMTSGPTPN